MRAFLLRLLGADKPAPPRVAELAARLSDVELGLEQLDGRLEDAVKAINARITNKLRKNVVEDAPGEEIPEQPESQHPPQRARPSGTAFLARRFRAGG